MKHRIVTARIVLAFSLVACGASESAWGDTPPVADKATDPKVVEKISSDAGPTLEEVEALIAQRWSKLKSVKASVLTTKKTIMPRVKEETTTQGHLIYMRRDGKNYFLKELKTRGRKTPFGKPEFEVKTHAKNICRDDTCYYVYKDEKGKDKVYMSSVETVNTDFGGEGIFNYIRLNHIPKLLPSTVFEGEEVYVIEARGNPGTIFYLRTITAYISKKTGMLRKMVTTQSHDMLLLTTKYYNIELNPPVDPKLFDYKPDGDVRVLQKVTKKKDGSLSPE